MNEKLGSIAESQVKGHAGAVRSLAFSSDGKRLASASGDRTVAIWDVDTWECLQKLTGHRKSVGTVCFLPGTSALASASADRHIRLWDCETGECKGELGPHGGFFFGGVATISAAPDGRHLASSGGKTFRVWDLEQQSVVAEHAHAAGIFASCNGAWYAPDGQTLYSVSSGRFKGWEAGTWRDLGEVMQSPNRNQDAFFSAGGSMMAAVGWNPVDIWDLQSRKPLAQIDVGNFVSLDAAFVGDGPRIVIAAGGAGVGCWDVHTGAKEWDIVPKDMVSAVAVHEPAGLIALGYAEGAISIGRLGSL